jgi:hypothetical protein
MANGIKFWMLLTAFMPSNCSHAASCSSAETRALFDQTYLQNLKSIEVMNVIYDLDKTQTALQDIITTGSNIRKTSCKATYSLHFEYTKDAKDAAYIHPSFPPDLTVLIRYDLEVTDDGRLYLTLPED